MSSLDDKPDNSGSRTEILYRRLAYLLLSLAAAWLISVSCIILFLHTHRNPWPRGYEFLDGITRYLSSISKSEFSPVEFFAIEFWSLYLTVFLASLGAVGGLFKLYRGIQASSQKDFSAERRDNILILACASASAIILGSSAVLASVRKKYLLQKFYALEVHLVRFEGLMFSSLSLTANHKLIDTFLDYMIGYSARIETLLGDISNSYDFADHDKIYEEMLKFAEAVKELKAGGFGDKTQTSDDAFKVETTLQNLLGILEYLQEAVRQHIRRLER